MPAKDSQWTYVHMANPHHVLYQEKWINDKLVFDDIDFNAILVQQQQKAQFQHANFLKNAILADEDEDDALNVPANQPQFGASRNHKKLLANNLWKDLDLQKFLEQNPVEREATKDRTILIPVDNAIYDPANDFLTEMVNAESSSSLGEEQADVHAFVVQDESGDTVMNNNNDTSSTTPLKNGTKKKAYYQTPVGRILR